MPIIKPGQALPQHEPIIVLYGDPGTSKTSISNTCENPLLLDFDKGVQRSIGRGDTLIPDNWEEVQKEERAGTFNQYTTIVVDTAKAALDDYLKSHVIRQDYSLKKNKLQMFGAIADEFQLFINSRRENKQVLFVLAHSIKDDDSKKMVPDVTGGSRQLLYRIADQIGYISIKNGQRVITWEPAENNCCKNTAWLPDTTVPDKNHPDFKGFGARLVAQVKESISRLTEEQRAAQELSQQYQDKIVAAETPDDLTAIAEEVKDLPEYLRYPLRNVLQEKAAAQAWKWEKEQKKYVPINDTAAALTFDLPALTNMLAAVKNDEEVAQIYFEYIDVIEADDKMKGMINAAMKTFGKEDIAGVATPPVTASDAQGGAQK